MPAFYPPKNYLANLLAKKKARWVNSGPFKKLIKLQLNNRWPTAIICATPKPEFVY
jgi:hypothetical protein